MQRKPSLMATGKLSSRERVWAAIRKLRRFTYGTLERAVGTDFSRAGLGRETIEGYVRALERAKFVAREGTCAPGVPQEFRLVKDAGVEAPRINGEGKPLTMGDKQQALWNAMRIVKSFTLVELAAAASTEHQAVSFDAAKKFVRYLRLAGYVTEAQPAHPGRQAVYRFINAKYTGPRAPVISVAAHVYDPNLGQVVWHPEAHA